MTDRTQRGAAPAAQTVETLWQMFRVQVVPKKASQAQIDDMQMSFYSGAASIMRLMRQLGEPDDISEDQGGEILEAIDRELQKFTVELMAKAMAGDIARATGVEVNVQVHDVTKPRTGGVH